ncbi:alcohol dehydrogenase catalytic domain-containing protein [Cellulomonas sp. P22]|uniref:alcohol dehydrogenase catalytic domain-containing protein n=1 Tax=Cellulomonas sp. P22 TaxID=3373189 RepID=UPI0037B628F8
MTSMLAYRMLEWGRPPRSVEVDVPEPGPGQVLVRMVASGVCATDLRVMDTPEGAVWGEVPFTLGHESAGRVAELGPGVEGLEVGDGVLVSGVLFCGRCDRCVRGLQHQCRHLRLAGHGTGDDGGLAEYLLAEARHVVPLGPLDPVAAAPLAGPGAAAYRAVQEAAPLLVPGSSAVVIGLRGPGSFAVQYLAQLTGAQVVALDPDPDLLADARRWGAEEAFAPDGDAAALVHELTGTGADVVLDLVATDRTLAIAVGALGAGGRVVVDGDGSGTVALGCDRLPRDGGLVCVSGCTPADLRAVVALAIAGRLAFTTTTFPFAHVDECVRALRDGDVKGCAVVTLG